MGLFIYVRHTSNCANRDDRFYRRCRCPKWIRGILGGREIRKSAKTRSWEKAQGELRKLERQAEEASGTSAKPASKELITIEHAVDRFLASKKNIELAESTLEKLNLIFKEQFLPWTKSSGLVYMTELNVDRLDEFRDTWNGWGALTKKKKQERLVSFFRFCKLREWISNNPAKLLGKIKAEQTPTDYFPPPEFDRIIDATYIYNPKAWNTEPRNQATRVRTFIRLLRWSGLRITDAVGLERSRLNDKDELLLHTMKTGQDVYIPLPHDVAEDLRKLPPGMLPPNPRYFFWSGNGKIKSAVSDWRRSLERVFALADITLPDGTPKRCHPHMLRDTFAVELLLAGVDLKEVSILLGHQSVKVTEKHYAPWVKARQERLTASVKKAWPREEPRSVLKSCCPRGR